VRARADWSYVQARLQARHGERLEEGDWRALEAARSLDHFLDRARMSSLRRFTERLDRQMSAHAIERGLRAEWRRYLAEVAGWVPSAWEAAVLWTKYVPELPLIDSLLGKAAPDWAGQDPILAGFADGTPRTKLPAHERAAIALLLPGNAGTLPERWLAHWRTLWPHGRTVDRARLDRLCAMVADHSGRLADAGPQDTSRPYRLELARACERMFRRHGAAPTAVFSHLTLVALDLERLRGGLVRRQLFHAAGEGVAA
jgi:hypothetical protein